MNESDTFKYSPIYNMCRVCLKTTDDVIPLLDEHKELYRRIVDEVALEEYNMKSCLFCHWMLLKFSKFKNQCQSANNLLNKVLFMDSNSHRFLQTLSSAHNFTTSNLETNEYEPYPHYNDSHEPNVANDYQNSNNDDIKHEIKEDVALETDCQNLSVSDYNDNIKDVASNLCSNENIDVTIKDDTESVALDYVANDYVTQDSDDDNDDIPLLLLQNVKIRKRKSKKNKRTKELFEDKEVFKDVEIKKEVKVKKENVTPVKSKKGTKEMKDGFTSRMVKETDEYVVIKLTKEQVLKEMDERMKSESYIRSPFRCDKCVKGFNFADVLHTHMEKHSVKNGNFECDMCGQYCRSAVSLRGHIKSHTTRYKCKLCGHIRLSRQHLLEHHAISHTSAPVSYNCDYCSFTTNKRTVMQRHVRRHSADDSFACHKCGKMFKSIESLRQHTVRHDKSSQFKCNECDATFVYHSLLRKHIQCVHERRDYYCVECDVQFKTAESLKLHFKKAKKHRDPSSYKHICPQCPARFPAAAPLSVHLSAVHNAPKSHSCSRCRRLYSSQDALRAHAWRVHAHKEARVSCPQCGTAFTSKSSLKMHMNSHSTARLHSCHCGVSFTQESTLQTHIQDKHTKDEAQQYENKVEL